MSNDTIRLNIKALELADGSVIYGEPGGITVIVGGNNSGKSSVLRSILADATGKSPEGNRGVVPHRVNWKLHGGSEQFANWLTGNFKPNKTQTWSKKRVFEGYGLTINEDEGDEWIRGSKSRSVAAALCLHLTAERRLASAASAPTIHPLEDPVKHAVQLLLSDPELEHKLSAVTRPLFGVDVIVNHVSGERMRVHCGDRPQKSDRASHEYLRQLQQLPLIEEQGDGVRSLVGLLIELAAPAWSVALIDEPEMFLHPPQAYALGTILGSSDLRDRQLVIATHSAEFLRGLLDAKRDNVSVLRLSRTRSTFASKIVATRDCYDLCHQPAFSFSNLPTALFYQSAVLCESDADCRFYNALLSTLYSKAEVSNILFLPVSGKQRLAQAADLLRRVHVRTAAIADFDCLNAQHTIRALANSLGINWEQALPNWKVIDTEINTKSPRQTPTRSNALSLISARLQSRPKEAVSEDDRHAVADAVSERSGWAMVKRIGKHALSGSGAQRFLELDKQLREHGLFLVPVGELECFHRQTNGHGSDWVSAVLESVDLGHSKELEEARQFCQSIAQYLGIEQNGSSSNSIPALPSTSPSCSGSARRLVWMIRSRAAIFHIITWLAGSAFMGFVYLLLQAVQKKN